MSKNFLIIILIIIVGCKKNETANSMNIEDIPKIILKFEDLDLIIHNRDSLDFKINYEENVVSIIQNDYANLNDVKISIEANKTIKNLQKQENTQYGLIQYTVDDNPAFPLSVFFNSNEEIRKVNKSSFKTKKNNQAIEAWLEKEYIKVIKKESFQVQNVFYDNLLKNQAQYLDCCPEYIEKAKKFKNSEISTPQNLRSLNLEPFILKKTIYIKYILDNNMKSIVIKFYSSFSENKSEKKPIKEFILKEYNYDFNKDSLSDKIVIIKNNKKPEEFDKEHFGLTIKILKNSSNGFTDWVTNNEVIFDAQSNCISEGFENIVFKNNYFTIEQQTCYDYNILVHSYTTFKIINDKIFLHKYGEEYFDKSNHERYIPDKVWTTKDFGEIKFEDVTEYFLVKFRQKNLKKIELLIENR